MYGYTWLTGSELQVCTVHPYVCDVCMCVLVCVCWQILFPPFTMSPLIDLWSSPPRERLEPYRTRERESSLFLSHRHHLQLVLPPLLFISILPPVTPSLPPLLEHPFVHPPLLLNALSPTPQLLLHLLHPFHLPFLSPPSCPLSPPPPTSSHASSSSTLFLLLLIHDLWSFFLLTGFTFLVLSSVLGWIRHSVCVCVVSCWFRGFKPCVLSVLVRVGL